MVIENSPGTLAEVGAALGEENVDIMGFDVQAQPEFGTLRFVTNDPAKTEEWLESTRFSYRVRDLVTVAAEDRPGELGRLAQTLSGSGINIDAAYCVSVDGDEQVGFAVNDAPSAIKALSE